MYKSSGWFFFQCIFDCPFGVGAPWGCFQILPCSGDRPKARGIFIKNIQLAIVMLVYWYSYNIVNLSTPVHGNSVSSKRKMWQNILIIIWRSYLKNSQMDKFRFQVLCQYVRNSGVIFGNIQSRSPNNSLIYSCHGLHTLVGVFLVASTLWFVYGTVSHFRLLTPSG